MLNYIIWYLFIGVMFNLLVDLGTDYAKSKGITPSETQEWNWQSRIFVCIFWPIGIAFYVSGYLKERYKNKKD